MERKNSARSKWGDSEDAGASAASFRVSLPRGPSFLGVVSGVLGGAPSKQEDDSLDDSSEDPVGSSGGVSTNGSSTSFRSSAALRKSAQLSPMAGEKPRGRTAGAPTKQKVGLLVTCLRFCFVLVALLACLLSTLNLVSLLVCENNPRQALTWQYQVRARRSSPSALGPGGAWGRGDTVSASSTLSSAATLGRALMASRASHWSTSGVSGSGYRGSWRAKTSTELSTSPGSTAVCLVGGARSFEATGPSILKHVIRRYDPCDVFLNAPLDADSAKYLALSPASSLVSVRIFANCDVDETQHPTDILQAAGSPQGAQGLLQYFRLVEGCLEMILHREQEMHVMYEWIVRARVDSYWRGPAPALSSLNRGVYTIPYGNDFHGYNDRFGAGLHRQAEVSMRRLSLMTAIKIANQSFSHNSEKAYKMQFVLNGVEVGRVHAPFCVLTHRLPSNITGACDPAVPSVASTLSLDGTKCMPCRLCDYRPDETEVMVPLYTYMSLVKSSDGSYEGSGLIQVCNLTKPWEVGAWEERFDAAAGKEMAMERQRIVGVTRPECVAHFVRMKKKTVNWLAPSPEALCLRRELGGTSVIGEGDGGFVTFMSRIRSSSVVIVARLKDEGDKSWEVAVQRDTRAKVVEWFQPDLSAFATSLSSIGASTIEVLKLSAEGHDSHLLSTWIDEGFELPVCQLLVTFFKSQAVRHVNDVLIDGWERISSSVSKEKVEQAHFQLDSCLGGQAGGAERCLFFSLKHCL